MQDLQGRRQLSLKKLNAKDRKLTINDEYNSNYDTERKRSENINMSRLNLYSDGEKNGQYSPRSSKRIQTLMSSRQQDGSEYSFHEDENYNSGKGSKSILKA